MLVGLKALWQDLTSNEMSERRANPVAAPDLSDPADKLVLDIRDWKDSTDG